MHSYLDLGQAHPHLIHALWFTHALAQLADHVQVLLTVDVHPGSTLQALDDILQEVDLAPEFSNGVLSFVVKSKAVLNLRVWRGRDGCCAGFDEDQVAQNADDKDGDRNGVVEKVCQELDDGYVRSLGARALVSKLQHTANVHQG